MVTRIPVQEAKQTAEHLEALRRIAEESSWQGRLATWAAVVGALAAMVAAVFAYLSYVHARNTDGRTGGAGSPRIAESTQVEPARSE